MILDPKQHTIAVRAAAALHRPDCLCTSCQPHLPIAERHLAVISRDDRRLAIQAEPAGDYYVGRRFYIERTQFWGYLRRPKQSWDDARLVIFNEKSKRSPDRLPEAPSGSGPSHGFDHNREYRVWGSYSGRTIYDPNSNLFLPEFVLQSWDVKSTSPGFLFHPGERYNGNQLLRREPEAIP